MHSFARPQDSVKPHVGGELFPEVQVFVQQLSVPEGAFGNHEKMVGRERLGQVVKGPSLDGFHGGFQGCVGGEHDDSQPRIQESGRAQDFHAVATGHFQVYEEQIVAAGLE